MPQNDLPPGVPAYGAGVANNAFAASKAANAAVGGNTANIANTTTNPTGATGPVVPAATPAVRPIIVAPASSGSIKDRWAPTTSNVFQDRFAPTQPPTPAQLSPNAQGARAANRVLLAGGGITASREAYLRTVQGAGQPGMTHQQALTNMLLAHMVGIMPDQQEETTTPSPTTVGEAKAYQS
jgi:hypothetical protein